MRKFDAASMPAPPGRAPSGVWRRPRRLGGSWHRWAVVGLVALGGCANLLGLDGFAGEAGVSGELGGGGAGAAGSGGEGTGGEGAGGRAAGTGGGETSCAGLPVVAQWDFEGADALDGLTARPALPGEVSNGNLLFDYEGRPASQDDAGRAYSLPLGSTAVSVCAAARWDGVLDGTSMLLAQADFFWASAYCGVFLAVRVDGAMQVFVVDNSGVVLDQTGPVIATTVWHDIGIAVDWVEGAASAWIDDHTIDVGSAALSACPQEAGNGTVIVAGAPLDNPGPAVRLAFDDLRVGRGVE